MTPKRPHVGRLIAGLAGCLALLAFAPVASAATESTDRAALEKRLQEARQQLDESAREVAELSRELYGGEIDEAMHFMHGGPRGSMLGINIGGGARDEGVEVMGVSPGGPAAQAGLKVGDVVLAVDGLALRRSGERTSSVVLVEKMRGIEPGSKVKVDYLRDGKRSSVSVTTAPAEPPIVRVIRERLAGPPGEGLPMLPGLHELLAEEGGFPSLELVPVTPKLGAYFGTDRGLLVVRVPDGEGLPLQEGDVLQTIGGRTPDSPGHAFRILHSYQPGEKVKLGVLRQRKQLTLEATMPAAPVTRTEGRKPRMPPPPPPRPAPPPGQ